MKKNFVLLISVFVLFILSIVPASAAERVFLFSISPEETDDNIAEKISQHQEIFQTEDDAAVIYVISWKLREQFPGIEQNYYIENSRLIIEVPGYFTYSFSPDNIYFMTVVGDEDWIMSLGNQWFFYKTKDMSDEEKYNAYLYMFSKYGENSLEEAGFKFGITDALIESAGDQCGENWDELSGKTRILIKRMIENRAPFSVFEKIVQECKSYK